MKVMFLSGSMQGGGAEHVVSILANYFVGEGIATSILVVRGGSVYPLDEKVRICPIYLDEEITSSIFNKVLRRFNYYPRLFFCIRAERPDVLIPVHGGGWNATMVVMAKLLGIKVIASEYISHTVGRHNLFRWIERHLVYKLADAVTVETEFNLSFYRKFLASVFVLPNPIGFIPVKDVLGRERVILAAGRLDSWSHKGFDNLLAVFSTVSKKHSDWRLQIAGAGDVGKAYLSQLAAQFGVTDQVDFIGFRKDLDQVMQQASIFVLSSRFEGFGMVLAEAMSQGCACISFDCAAGPAEIITDGVDGILVEDQNNAVMARELDRLMGDDALRKRLALAGLKKVEKFSVEISGQKWNALFRAMGLVF